MALLTDQATTAENRAINGQQLYQYYPLSGPDSFRIIKLLPCKHLVDRLECLLVEFQLTEPLDYTAHPRNGAVKTTTQEYEAISYAWGTNKKDKQIVIHKGNDKFVLPITESLHEALRAFRYSTCPRYLWADAVCINQADVQERSKQVAMMGSIFATAKSVLVWLGDPDQEQWIREQVLLLGNSDDLSPKAKRLAFDEPFSGCQTLMGSRNVLQFLNKRPWFNVFALDRSAEMILSIAMEGMLSRPWFSRRWILQEVALAREVYLYMGRDVMNEKTFDDFVLFFSKYCSSHVRMTPDLMSTFQASRVLWNLRKIPELKDDLLALLHFFHRSQCSDDRDLLYSLYGIPLSNKLRKPALHHRIMSLPDYTLTAGEIETKFAVDYIQTQGGADILHCAGTFRDPNARTEPSWIPNWRMSPMFESFLGVEEFEAGGTSRFIMNTTVTPDEIRQMVLSHDNSMLLVTENMTITLVGLIYDRVHAVTPCTFTDDVRELEALEKQVTANASLHGHPEYESLRGLYAHTLTAGWALSSRMPQIEVSFRGRRVAWRNLQMRRDVAHSLLMYERAINTPIDYNWPNFGETYRLAVKTAATGRCIIQGPYVGLAPAGTRPGDVIAILYGLRTPFILRPVGVEHCYRVVGDCYIYGLMNGEARQMEHLQRERFVII